MRSLKNRTAIVYLVTTALLIGVVYVAIFISASTILYNHNDNELLAEFKEVGSSMSIQDGKVYVLAQPEWSESEHGEATVSPVFLQAVDTSGTVIRTTANLRDTRLTFFTNRRDTFAVSIRVADAWIRQVQGPLYNHSGVLEGYLIVGVGIDEVKLLLGYLKWIMLISFPLIIGVIVVISRGFGSTIVAPITTLIDTADRISRENLDERVPLPKRQDELRHLSTTVNSLLDRLQEVILREHSFAADAAHELRTPLSVIKGTLEVLIRQPRRPEEYEAKLKYCLTEIDRMSNMVELLLLVARYESRSVELRKTTVDVAQRASDAVERIRLLALAKQITFNASFCDSAIAISDPLLLGAVLDNLLSNAVKYSPQNSQIMVNVREENEEICVTVSDAGPGMSPEQIAKIFSRFYRGDSSLESSTKGFGLGLALVRRLSDLLAIKVSIESAVGQGTTFLVRIPRHRKA